MFKMNLLQCSMKWSLWMYFHMVRNGHNKSFMWYEMATINLLAYASKWQQLIYPMLCEIVTIYLLPPGRKWSQWNYFQVVQNGHNESTMYLHMVQNDYNEFTFHVVRKDRYESSSVWYEMVTINLLPCGTNLLQYGMKWSIWIYFQMIPNGHNKSTSRWYKIVSINHLPYVTKWL